MNRMSTTKTDGITGILHTSDLQTAKSSVGEMLAEARGSQTLSQISKELCISCHHLEALEQGHNNAFSYVYGVGFLKNYAQYLKLNVGEMIEQYQVEFMPAAVSGSPSAEVIQSYATESVHDSSFSVARLSSYMAFSIVLMMGVWFSVTKTGILVEEGTQLDLSNNFTRIAGAVTSLGAEETQFSNAQVSSAQTAPHFSFIDKAEATVAPDIGGNLLKGTDIRLKAKADVWVRIIAQDHEILFDRIIHEGEEVATPHYAGMTLMTSNAGALILMQADRETKSLGAFGMIAQDISFSSESNNKSAFLQN